MRTMSLADHMETMRSYLNTYKASSHSTRREMSATCFEYIIMSCWRRMYRRVCHWSTHGLLYGLVDVMPKLTASISKHEWGEHIRDQALHNYLNALTSREDLLVLMTPRMNNQATVLEEYSLSSNIIDDCHVVLCVQRPPSPHEVYRKDTIIYFHHFLLAILFGYIHWLLVLRTRAREAVEALHLEAQKEKQRQKQRQKQKQKQKKQQEQTQEEQKNIDGVAPVADQIEADSGSFTRAIEEVERALFSLRVFIRVLFIVANSNALATHLELLHGTGMMTPTVDLLHMYKSFAIDNNLAGVKRDPVDNQDPLPTQNGHGDEEEEGEDFSDPANNRESPNNARVLRQLVLGLVGHFSAKHILERHVARLPLTVDVEFKLIAMPRSTAPVGSWNYIKQLVHRVVMGDDSPSDVALNVGMYMKRIQQNIDIYASAANRSSYHFVFDVFLAIRRHSQSKSDESGELPDFKGDKHCEAILAAVILFFDTTLCKVDDVAAMADLLNLRQVFWHLSTYLLLRLKVEFYRICIITGFQYRSSAALFAGI